MIGFFRGRETTSDAWVIGRWYEFPAEEAQAGFHDRVSTAAWLRTVEPEDLRRIAHQYIDGTLRSGLSDHDLVEQLVGLIVSGALRVWRITTPIRPRVSHEIAALRSETTLQTSGEPAVTPSQLAREARPRERGSGRGPENTKTWIEIRLVDSDGDPVPGERYRLRLPDASIMEGVLDDEGKARYDGIVSGSCQISFPGLDAREWRPV